MLEGVKEVGVALDGVASRTFGRVVDLIVKLLMPLAIVALMMGIARVFLDLLTVWRSPSIAAGFDVLVTDLLSMFVVIELLKSIVEYFEIHRLRITFILDAAIVFVVREVMIGLYRHELHAPEIAALGLLLLVVGAVRIAAVRFSPARSIVHAP
ncbi:MAG TPA: phosphate-starvation-inducible PsiE family protein [Anaeromyxobacter sp.]